MTTSRTPHIIVVDDEAPAREMVGDYLRLHGFEVTLCDGGASLRLGGPKYSEFEIDPGRPLPLTEPR